MSLKHKFCPICAEATSAAFIAKVLRKYEVTYFYCKSCGLLQTEKPYWLPEAYSDTITCSDTGLVHRNINISHRLTVLLFFLFEMRARYLDTAGGTGLLTRMMRDAGFDFYWRDDYCQNIHARGFEFDSTHLPYRAVTACEVLEHVEDPVTYISEVLSQSGTDTVIFTTILYKGQPPEPGKWWYYSHESGQHISFYQRRTLDCIAQKLRLRLFTHGAFHMMTKRDVSSLIYRLSVSRISHIISPTIRLLVTSKTMTDCVKMLNAPSAPSQRQP